MALTYTKYWADNAAAKTANGLVTRTGVALAVGDVITVAYVMELDNDFAGTLSCSNTGTALTWTKVSETNPEDFCRNALWKATSASAQTVSISCSISDGSIWAASMAVIVATGAHATDPVPSGNIFTGSGTDLSRTFTPTASGSAFFAMFGDWGQTNSYAAGAGCTIDNTHNFTGAYTSALIRPTTNPRTDATNVTISETDTAGAINYVAWEIQAAAGGSEGTPVYGNAVPALLGTPTFNTTAGTHAVTATPSVGDLIILICGNTGYTATTLPTDNNSGGAGTYVLAGANALAVKTTSADRLQVYVRTALIASGTSTVFTHAPVTTSGGGLIVVRVSGMTKTGTTAVRQVAKQDNQTSGTPAPVLPGAPLTQNALIAAVLHTANSTNAITPRTGWTELTEQAYNTPATGLEVMSRNSGETSATTTWGSSLATAFCSVVIELDTTTGGTLYDRTATDSVAATDASTRLVTIAAIAAESAAATDSADHQGTVSADATDAVAATDEATRSDPAGGGGAELTAELLTAINNVDLTPYDDYKALGDRNNGTNDAHPGTGLITGPTLAGSMVRVSSAPPVTIAYQGTNNVETSGDHAATFYMYEAARFTPAANGDAVAFVFPADTGTRKARIHLWTYFDSGPGGVFVRATLSDDSADELELAVNYIWENIAGTLYEFTYAAGSASQTLTLRVEASAGTSSAQIFVQMVSLEVVEGGGGPNTYEVSGEDSAASADSASSLEIGLSDAADSSAATDAANATGVLVRSATDSVAASDSATSLETGLASATDAVAATDSSTAPGTLVSSATDAAAAGDSATGLAVRPASATDPVAAGDSATSTAPAFSRSATDAVAAGDSATSAAPAFALTATDPAAAGDSATSTAPAFARSATDSVAASDSATTTGTFSASATDAIAASDSATTGAQPFALTATDTAAAGDSATTTGAFAATVADAAAAGDSATGLAVRPASATDAAAAADAATTTGTFSATATDSAAASDQATTGALPAQLAAVDAVTAGDSSSTQATSGLQASDAVAAADSATSLATGLASATDAVAATDAAVTLLGASVSATDAAVATDAAFVSVPGFNLLAADAVTATDAANATRYTFVEAADSVGADDLATVAGTSGVTAADSASATDSATTQAALQSTAADSAAATDAAALASVYTAIAIDAILALDEATSEVGEAPIEPPTPPQVPVDTTGGGWTGPRPVWARQPVFSEEAWGMVATILLIVLGSEVLDE